MAIMAMRLVKWRNGQMLKWSSNEMVKWPNGEMEMEMEMELATEMKKMMIELKGIEWNGKFHCHSLAASRRVCFIFFVHVIRCAET